MEWPAHLPLVGGGGVSGILVFYTITSEYTIIKNIYENTLFYVLKF